MRLIGILIGLALIVVGVPLVFTPLPVGLLMAGLGTVVLVASSPFAARRLKAWRSRSKTLNRAVGKAEDILPDALAEPLERTDPDPDPEAEAAAAARGRPLRRMSARERGRRARPLR